MEEQQDMSQVSVSGNQPNTSTSQHVPIPLTETHTPSQTQPHQSISNQLQPEESPLDQPPPTLPKSQPGETPSLQLPSSSHQSKPHKKPQPHQPQPPTRQAKTSQHQGKKKKGVVVENQERINYLYQVSRYLASLKTNAGVEGRGQPNDTAQTTGKERNEGATHRADRSIRERHGLLALASQTGYLAQVVGRKCVQRLTPSLKRTMCKGCGIALVYGVNAKVRHRSHRQKHIVVTCLTCRTIKRFNNDPKHKLWFEQEEACV
ncbi:hypothetical protein Pcinc_040317 [Petrolisthes cinctipes]|uniref:Uncharacterized protein n=1 Tax=Petrolisthes cinctipes TaxID=88211 RepID=A0AAE1EJP2_PETCI|nr:hypothetical protein Pcinc_040317 [Petrolisthes cinctipes]